MASVNSDPNWIADPAPQVAPETAADLQHKRQELISLLVQEARARCDDSMFQDAAIVKMIEHVFRELMCPESPKRQALVRELFRDA